MEWRVIPHCEGYYANELGQIKGRSGKILRPKTDKCGYRQVVISYDGVRIMKTVHLLVALAFLGERPTGADIDHIDCNRGNNRPENLRYVSHKYNVSRIGANTGHAISCLSNPNHHIIRRTDGWYEVKYVYRGKRYTKTYRDFGTALANRNRLLKEWGYEEHHSAQLG